MHLSVRCQPQQGCCAATTSASPAMFRWQPIVANRATGSRGLVAYDGRTSRVTYLETLRISGSRGRSRRIMRSGALAANGEEPRDTSHGVTSAPGYTSDSDSEGIDLIESDICDGAIAPTGGLVRTPTGKKLKLHLYHVDAAPETGGKRDLLNSASPLGLVSSAVALGVLNRVLYRMSLVPLADYTYFLSQMMTLAYLVTYFGVLGARKKAGMVTPEMLAVPRRKLWAVGALDAVGLITGMIGASQLPGVVLPLLGQTAIIWQVILSRLLLRKRLVPSQLAGVAAVIAGVVVVGWPSDASASLELTPTPVALMLVSMALPALSSIIKEKFFRDAKAELGQPIDLFVVNSYSSLAQATFTLLLLPLIVHLRGLSMAELPGYLKDGAMCFAGQTPGCVGTPLVPMLYVGANLMMNVAMLAIVRQQGALVVSLVSSSLTPLTILAFTLPLPLLGASPELGAQFFAGCTVLLGGVVLYNWQSWEPKLREMIGGSENEAAIKKTL